MTINVNAIKDIAWECSICKDVLPDMDSVASRRCLHMFHEVCIKNALEQKRECPNCRLEGLEVSQLIPCENKRIQRIYNRCVLSNGSLEKELYVDFPEAKKVADGYEITDKHGSCIIQLDDLILPKQLWGRGRDLKMQMDDAGKMFSEIRNRVDSANAILANPNESEEKKTEATEQLKRLEIELNGNRKTYNGVIQDWCNFVQEWSDSVQEWSNSFKKQCQEIGEEQEKISKGQQENLKFFQEENKKLSDVLKYNDQYNLIDGLRDEASKRMNEISRKIGFGFSENKDYKHWENLCKKLSHLSKNISPENRLSNQELEETRKLVYPEKTNVVQNNSNLSKQWSFEAKLAAWGITGAILIYIFKESYNLFSRTSIWIKEKLG